jgi:esterase
MSLQLSFEATGKGPSVVILHGLFGSGRNWRSVAQALATQYRVYCVDLRNHGSSPWAASMSYSEMAADVRMLIESEGLGAPVVIGHSMGGKTAMALALTTPAMVGRLIVVDIAPVSYVDRFTSYVEAMRAVDTQSLTQRADAMRQITAKVQNTDVVGFLMQNLVMRDEHFDWRLNLAVIGAEVPVLSGFPPELLLHSYEGNAALIRGSLSDYVQPADEAALSESFPTMRVVEIERAGHWVHADQPTEFLAALGLLPAVIT